MWQRYEFQMKCRSDFPSFQRFMPKNMANKEKISETCKLFKIISLPLQTLK